MALVAPIFSNSDDYFADIEAQMKSAEYADTMRHVFTPTMILIWGVATFIVCLIAGFIGMRTLKKHFTRAGIV
ncbi:MptD family putative ECF transporter S component [Corynebacterium matruchotii]